MNIIFVAVLGVAAVLVSIQFKTVKPEYSSYISLAACIIIFGYSLSKLSTIVDGIHQMTSYISIKSSYVTTLIKIVGVTYIAQFTSDLCKDAGYSAISNQIQIFGKLAVLAISMPILLALLETINGFLK